MSDVARAIRKHRLTLKDHVGRLDELALETRPIPGGNGPFPRSTDPEETIRATYAGIVKFVVAPAGQKVEIAIDGSAVVAFSDTRLFGFMARGTVDGSANYRLDRSGNGRVMAFTIFRGLWDEIDEQRGGFRKKLQAVTLGADHFGFSFDAVGVKESTDEFRAEGNEGFLTFARTWVEG